MTRAGSAACTRRSRTGLTAEAAVERVQDDTRVRVQRQADPLCASGCMISTISPTGCCACSSTRRTATAGRTAATTRSSSRAPWGRPSFSTTTANAARPRAGGGRSDQPCRHRRPGARHRHGRAGRAIVVSLRENGDAIVVDGEVRRGASPPVRPNSRRPMPRRCASGPGRQAQLPALRDLPAVTRDGVRDHADDECRPARRPAASRRSRAPTASACSAPSCSS